jgi:transcriptional regulator with XRE-family HTH domain
MVERPPVGRVIRSLRRALDLTQVELARECGISSQFLSLLELGEVNVSLDVLVALSARLGQPLSAIFLAAEKPLAPPRTTRRKRKRVA